MPAASSLLLVLLLCGQTTAEPPASPPVEPAPAVDAEALAKEALKTATAEQMTFFRDPSAEAFAVIRDGIDRHAQAAGIKPSGLLPLTAFLAAAAERYDYDLPGDSRVLRAARATRSGDTSDPWAKYLLDDSITPGRLDVWWGRYFATGDEEYLRKVLRHVRDDDEKPAPGPEGTVPRQAMIEFATAAAAKWSFGALARQIPEVAEFTLVALKEEEFEPIKVWLIVTAAGKRLPPGAVERLRRRNATEPGPHEGQDEEKEETKDVTPAANEP